MVGKKSLPKQPSQYNYGTLNADGRTRTYDEQDVAAYREDYIQWRSDVSAAEEARRQTYNLAMAQCHPTLLATLKEDPSFEKMKLVAKVSRS